MELNRRSLVRGAIGAGATGIAIGIGHDAMAQSPPATPATAGAETPDAIVAGLREMPITSPLFPRDSGDLTILDWVDEGDSDLEGAVAAFFVEGPPVGEDGKSMIGAYMVHATADVAAERFSQQLSDGQDERPAAIFEYPSGWGHYPDGAAVVGVVTGSVIVSAAAMGPKRGPDEPAVTDFREADARALANLAGMLDHLRMVTAKPE